MRALPLAVAGVLTLSPVSAEVSDNKDEAIDYAELSVKNLRPAKGFPFDVVLEQSSSKIDRVLFNREYKGRLCFFSCHFYDGVISKWTNFFVEIQPYENTCFSLAGGCNSTAFADPGKSLNVMIGKDTFSMQMSDPSKNQYYLPLALRKALLVDGGNNVLIETNFPKYPIYRLGEKTRAKLREVLDTSQELVVEPAEGGFRQSKAEKLTELEALYESGKISEEEYRQARSKIISE